MWIVIDAARVDKALAAKTYPWIYLIWMINLPSRMKDCATLQKRAIDSRCNLMLLCAFDKRLLFSASRIERCCEWAWRWTVPVGRWSNLRIPIVTIPFHCRIITLSLIGAHCTSSSDQKIKNIKLQPCFPWDRREKPRTIGNPALLAERKDRLVCRPGRMGRVEERGRGGSAPGN